MEIIALTQKGVLIKATDSEVKNMLTAVHGKNRPEIEIGTKIPAIDYATSIVKIKELAKNNYFEYMVSRIKDFNTEFDRLTEAVKSVANIDL